MKKVIVILLVLVTALCFSAVACKKQPCKDGEHVFVDGVCSVCGEEEKVERKLMRIRITQEPTKTQYEVGEVFDPAGMVVTASYNDSTTETVTDYEIDKTGALTADDTTVTVTYQGKTTSVNIKVTAPFVYVQGAKILTADNAVYTIEAEDLDYSNCVNSNDYSKKPTIESPGDSTPETSGGKSVGTLSVPGNKFGFTIECEVECNITLIMRASATHVDIPVDSFMEFTLNGEVVTCGYTLTWESGRWFGWEHATFTGLTLSKGMNEVFVKIKAMNSPNIDCFYVIVSPTGEESLLDMVKNQSQETKETTIVIPNGDMQTYRIEAEELDYSNCVWNNGATGLQTEDNADGGKSVVALGKGGNKFGFSVQNDGSEDLTVTFLLRASANGGNMVLDDVLSITLNGETISTNATLTWNGSWNVCESVSVNALTLRSGLNEIEIVTKNDACPNIDYFEIIVG